MASLIHGSMILQSSTATNLSVVLFTNPSVPCRRTIILAWLR